MAKTEVVPDGWERRKLSDLIKFLDAGVSVNSEDRPAMATEFGILKTSAVNNGSFIARENKVIRTAEIERAKINPIKGSIIISRMNTPQLVGEIGYIQEDFENLFLPDRLWQTNFHRNVSGKWLAELLTLSGFRKQIKSIATGTSNTMKNISQKDFLSLEVLYAPFEEQKKIAAILTIWDKAIGLKEKLIEQKKEQKKGLMQKLVTGEVRLPGFDGEWKEARLEYLGKCIRGVSYKPEDLFLEDNSKSVRLLRSNNIQEYHLHNKDIQYVDQSRVKSNQLLLKTDIVISMANGSKHLVGKNGEYKFESEIPYTVGAFCGIFRFHKINKTGFAKYLFQTSKYEYYVQNLLTGSSINNLKPSDIESMKFNMPTEQLEVQRLSRILDTISGEIEIYEKELSVIINQKQGLMQNLLTGKVRVKA